VQQFLALNKFLKCVLNFQSALANQSEALAANLQKMSEAETAVNGPGLSKASNDCAYIKQPLENSSNQMECG